MFEFGLGRKAIRRSRTQRQPSRVRVRGMPVDAGSRLRLVEWTAKVIPRGLRVTVPSAVSMQMRPTSARHLVSGLFDECLEFPVGDLKGAKGEPGNRDFNLRSSGPRQVVLVMISPIVEASRLVLGRTLHVCAGGNHDHQEPSYANAPTDGSALVADPCEARSLRGGSWSYLLSSFRSADRSDDPPDALFDGVGFRVARDLDVAVAPVPDWDLRVYEDRELGFSFLYPARLERSEESGYVAFAEDPRDMSYIEDVPSMAVNVTRNDSGATARALAEAFAGSLEGEVLEVTSEASTLRDGVTDAVEIVVDWRHAGTGRVLRTTSLSIALGDQRVSIRSTRSPGSDWADLKRLLYTLRVH